MCAFWLGWVVFEVPVGVSPWFAALGESPSPRRRRFKAATEPDPGVPREWVDAAREAIKDNRRPPSTNRRFWELSGSLFIAGVAAT